MSKFINSDGEVMEADYNTLRTFLIMRNEYFAEGDFAHAVGLSKQVKEIANAIIDDAPESVRHIVKRRVDLITIGIIK